jgi:phage shock protein A
MTKQTVPGRVSQLARTNVDALLDQAEDPRGMADGLVRAYDENIQEAERAVTAALRLLRLLAQDRAEDLAAAAEWGGKARSASRKADELRIAGGFAEADRFDTLARFALGRQLRAEQDAAEAEPVLDTQNAAVERLKLGLDRMRATRDRLRTRREELLTASRTEPARHPLGDGVTHIDVLDPTCDLARFEEKTRREEIRAGGHEALAASALDGHFESLDLDVDAAEVDRRLARLKTRG